MVDAVTAAWHEEYRYRQLFPMTHWEFNAEPPDAVQWMLRIDQIYADIRQQRRNQPPQ